MKRLAALLLCGALMLPLTTGAQGAQQQVFHLKNPPRVLFLVRNRASQFSVPVGAFPPEQQQADGAGASSGHAAVSISMTSSIPQR